MTQPDPSDRLTPAARNKLNRLDVPKPTTEAGRMLLRDVVDHSEHYHATSDLPMAGHVPSMILAIEQEARADAAAQTAAAVKALREISETQGKVCENFELCEHESCRSSYAAWHIATSVLADLDAVAKQHDEAVAERAVQPWRDVLLLLRKRDMLDGSPCWCISDDKPHEGWAHGLFCEKARALLAQAPSSEFEGWQDALSDPLFVTALDEGLADVQAGRVTPWAEVRESEEQERSERRQDDQ